MEWELNRQERTNRKMNVGVSGDVSSESRVGFENWTGWEIESPWVWKSMPMTG